ncbi:hypothetical protein VNO78_39604 [Psophocarpus tetragonolobus]|uniref:Uncharacterized protein n=1 Tax=Psophocarpus tetragonolobus TaxID=3891 RepID=A0AAN9N2G6_PSOTE
MLRGVENKRRSGDSRYRSTFRTAAESTGRQETTCSGERNGSSLNRENGVVGELYKCRAARRSSGECCTLDGESPVAESITSLRSDPSSMGHVESRVNQQGPPCKAKYSWVTDSEVVPGEMPLEPRASWFSPKCVEAQQLTRHLGVKHCFGSRSASETMGDKLHRREGNSPDHQLRPLNDRSVIKEMNGAKRSAEAVGCKNESVGERSALEGRTRASSAGRSGSENVGLSNANVGENPMPRKPKGSSARFVHGGVIRGRENTSSQSSSTRRYSAEVIHAILPGKARTTFNKWVPVPETDTEGVPPHKGGRSDQARATVKEVGDLMTGEPTTEAPVNGGRNYNGPKVAKFLVGLGGGQRRPPSGGARAISEIPLWKS